MNKPNAKQMGIALVFLCLPGCTTVALGALGGVCAGVAATLTGRALDRAEARRLEAERKKAKAPP